MTNSPRCSLPPILFIAAVKETDHTGRRWRFSVTLIHHLDTEGTIIPAKDIEGLASSDSPQRNKNAFDTHL